MDIIVVLAVDEKLIARAAVFLETNLFVAAASAFVAGENAETNAVKIEVMKTVVENEIDGFGAVAVAVKIGVTDENTEYGGASGKVELFKTDGADELVFVFGDNAEIAAALALGERGEMVAFGTLGEKLASATEIVGDFGVVEPFGEGFDGFIGHINGGEIDPVTDEFLKELHGVPFRLLVKL